MSDSQSTSDDQAAGREGDDGGCQLAELEFVESMDAIQEYLQLQVKLQDQLKQGLLSLAKAKYSMGPIGQAQYDMDMSATARITATSSSTQPPGPSRCRTNLCLSKANPAVQPGSGPSTETNNTSPSAAGSQASAASTQGPASTRTTNTTGREAPLAQSAVPEQLEQSAAGRGGRGGEVPSGRAGERVPKEGEEQEDLAGVFSSSGGSDGEDHDEEEEEEEMLREAHEFLRRMRMQADGLQDDEAGGEGGKGRDRAHGDSQGESSSGRRRGGGGGSGKGGRGGRKERVAKDPLQWFGVLLPPALKEAQGQFKAVLETCVALANAAQRFRPDREGTAASAAATPASKT